MTNAEKRLGLERAKIETIIAARNSLKKIETRIKFIISCKGPDHVDIGLRDEQRKAGKLLKKLIRRLK